MVCFKQSLHVYKDHGISGAKGRDKRPGFHALCRDAAQRKFDLVMAWSVDRLEGVRKIAARFGVDPSVVQRISRPFGGASAVM
jgi:DNA invertase Pin-like site-specific DNA recombinase